MLRKRHFSVPVWNGGQRRGCHPACFPVVPPPCLPGRGQGLCPQRARQQVRLSCAGRTQPHQTNKQQLLALACRLAFGPLTG